APAALADPRIRWEPLDDVRARATLTNAGHTVRAELEFNAAGELVNFRSDDRLRASADGRTMTAMRWSTPLRGYRDFGPYRLAGRGDARWHDGTVEFAYIEFEIDDIRYDPE